MFVKAATAAGGDITRDKVLEQLQTFTTFDADGFLAPINPVGKKPSPCFMVVMVEGGAWKRVYPESGFAC